MQPTYAPQVFDRSDEASARAIILTPEGGQTTAQRWARETPWIVERLCEDLAPALTGRAPYLLDFGCGIGRIAKPMLAWGEARGLRVIGVDNSAHMLNLAQDYVGKNDRFLATTGAGFDRVVAGGGRVEAIAAVWVLQHVLDLQSTLETLRRGLRPGGRLAVVNNFRRCVPTNFGWVDDGLDITDMLNVMFDPVLTMALPAENVFGETLAGAAFYGVWQKRENDGA